MIAILLFLFPIESHAMVFTKLPHFVMVKKKMYQIDYLAEVDNGKLAGVCFTGKDKLIEVSLDSGLEEAQSTLFHEILHAIAAEYKFDLSENKVLELEKALYETFKKNHWKVQVK